MIKESSIKEALDVGDIADAYLRDIRRKLRCLAQYTDDVTLSDWNHSPEESLGKLKNINTLLREAIIALPELKPEALNNATD